MVTDTNARLRWSRPGLDHESPNACLVANRRKSSPDCGSPMPKGRSRGLPNNSAAISNAAVSARSLCSITPFQRGWFTNDARRLDGRESAVDGQCGAVHVRGVVADEERDGGRDLFWC